MGTGVGCGEGSGEGCGVGTGTGWDVGCGVGTNVGCTEKVGRGVGCIVGLGVGLEVGLADTVGTGDEVGATVSSFSRTSSQISGGFILTKKLVAVVSNVHAEVVLGV